MRFDEIAPIKAITPDKQRIQAMRAQVKKSQDVLKAERARQKIKAGQNQLTQASRI